MREDLLDLVLEVLESNHIEPAHEQFSLLKGDGVRALLQILIVLLEKTSELGCLLLP